MTMQDANYPFMRPSSTCISEDLLFFDTFSHSNSDKSNFDLVQFPSPVIIDFIKIVPLGQPVEANIPGNVRLGATNPSKCELEFFINDLTKQDAHTMTDLGKFYCSEKDTDFNPPLQIQTDGLLLRGNYRTLTLAIFGSIVTFDEKLEEDPAVMMSATSPPAQTPASPIASEKGPSFMVENEHQELLRASNDPEESLDESTQRSCELTRDTEMLDHVNEDDTTTDLADNDNEGITKKDVLKGIPNNIETAENAFNVMDSRMDEYSDSSDLDSNKKTHDTVINNETSLATENRSIRRSESKSRMETADPDMIKNQTGQDDLDSEAEEWTFEAEKFSPRPLNYFPEPSTTLQEKAMCAHKINRSAQNTNDSVEKEVEKVKEMFDVLGCSADCKTEDWVTLVEDLTNDISNMSLSHIINSKDMLDFLVQQVLHGLNLDLALKQRQTGFKVRHLKAGLKLATILFHCGDTSVNAMLDAGVLHHVLRLYNQDQMSLPLQLLIFRCLSTACDTVAGVRHIFNQSFEWEDPEVPTKNLLTTLSKSSDETYTKAADAGQSNALTCFQYMLLILLSKPTTRVMIAIGNLIRKVRLFMHLNDLASACNTCSEDSLEESEDEVFDSSHIEDKAKLESHVQIMQNIVRLMDDNCSSISQPLRHLPAKVQFHLKPCPDDTYLAIFKWFEYFSIVECIHLLLVFSRKPSIIDSESAINLRGLCLILVQHLLGLPRGTQFMLSKNCCQSTQRLLKTLAYGFEPTKLRLTSMEGLPDVSLCPEVSLSFAACRDLSLKLGYHFKVLLCIDRLFEFHRDLLNTRTGNPLKRTHDPEKVLHELYIMTDHPYGLAAMMKHFSFIGNLDSVLRFLDMPDYQLKHMEFVKETSIDYVLELVGTFLRLNNNILEIRGEYLDTLVDLSKTKDKTLATRLKSLLPWLTPFDPSQPFPVISYSDETFRQITRVIRKSIPDRTIPFAQGFNFEIPPQLITAVRILRQLCIPPQVEALIESTFDTFSPKHLMELDEQTRSKSLPFVDSSLKQPNQNQSWNLNPQGGYQDQRIDLYDDDPAVHIKQLAALSKLFQPYDESICGDLKYHYGVMQLYEQENLRRLLNTLRELNGNYPRPLYQSAALSGQRGRIAISYIHSVIMLIHSVTCHLIDARGREFKDTSIISVVLETYSLMCFVPKPDMDLVAKSSESTSTNCDLFTLQTSITLQADNYKLAQQTKRLILSILMSHTQMSLSVSEAEENAISKSMWTKMLKEVVDFTLSAPVFFQHGLDVLTKILPSPLPPASILDTLDQEQLFENYNHRKLWSAHLHPLYQKLEFMISSLSFCNQREIRTLLCYLCNQLCDLSPNAACMVAKTTTDSIIACALRMNVNDESISSSEQALQPSLDLLETSGLVVTTLGSKESKYSFAMFLNLLSYLIFNQAFKTAFSNHLQALGKKDDRILVQLYELIRAESDDSIEPLTADDTSSGTTKVANIIDLIKDYRKPNDQQSTRITLTKTPQVPNEMTKINLMEMARKTTDHFNLSTSLNRTFRLKVLLDMNARARRTDEPQNTKKFDRSTPSYNSREMIASSSASATTAGPGGHSGGPFTAPLRGRARPLNRPDSFRSRPQNTSRPPSIHVDDFVDIYGDNHKVGDGGGVGAGGPGGSRYWPKPPGGGGPFSVGHMRAHSKPRYMKPK